ncbi:MAG: nucleotidyltransferase domain-containing protein [Gammaproteobacteria bacterium]
MLPEALRADLARYVELLKGRFETDLVSVVLFGSWPKGTARPESDVDVLVVIRGLPVNRWKRYDPLRPIARVVSDDFAAGLSVIALTPEEAATVKPYYLGMLAGHVLLLDRGGFFAGVLSRLEARLAELGARRYVDKDGYEYWDLKPDWKPGDVVEL